jgi:hypothetical protein
MYQLTLSTIFSAASDYNLKKLFRHTVVLKPFVYHLFLFEYQGNTKTGGAQIIYYWIFAIPSDILQSVVSKFGMRSQKIVEVEGKHIEHIMI